MPPERALALCPRSADAAHHLGHAMLLAGRTEEAITFFQKAVELDPGVAESHCNLANACMRHTAPIRSSHWLLRTVRCICGRNWPMRIGTKP